MKSASVNDVGSMSLSSLLSSVPNYYIVTLLNSNLLFDYYRDFLNCTVNIQINDIRQMPIFIPTSDNLSQIHELFIKAYIIKKDCYNEQSSKLGQIESSMNQLVSALYGI